MSRTLGWGLLGTARINRALIPAIRAATRSRLVGVASRTADRSASYAAEWSIETAYPSYEAMLADPAIDVVYIPLPNHLHVEWTLRAIAAGKHVLCEKPLALTPGDVDRVEAAARQRGVVVAEAFMYRHHPLTTRVAEFVRGGAIGTLRALRGTFSFPLTRPNDVRLVPEWGGGAAWDVGCYPVSYARLLAGAEPVAVTAQARMGPTGIDLGLAGTLRFPDGVLAAVDCAFDAHFRTYMEAAGTEGVIAIHTPFKPGERSVIHLTKGDETSAIEVTSGALYLGEVEDVERAALDGAPQGMPLADSRGNAAVLCALLEAAREGREVAIA
jgi:predicted dehydrogenase